MSLTSGNSKQNIRKKLQKLYKLKAAAKVEFESAKTKYNKYLNAIEIVEGKRDKLNDT